MAIRQVPLLLRIFIWEFPKIRGTILEVPSIRVIVFWGLYWGPLILGNYRLGKCILMVHPFNGPVEEPPEVDWEN